ncbi:MAG: FHA domain-containing protein [Anaerolineales bacterium]
MSGAVVLALRLAMTLALYIFLGWALYLLWQDVKKQSEALAKRRIPGIHLQASAAAPLAAKYFTQQEIALGRDPACDLPLDHDTVSTRHARLAYHHGQWWLEDLSSTNGTTLNNDTVRAPVVITSGDEIQCGAARISVTISPDAFITPTEKMERTA